MPMNPQLPPPPPRQRVVNAVKTAAHRHTNTIEVSILGVVLGVLVILVRPDVPLLGVMVMLAYASGALIESLVVRKGGK